MIDLCEGRTPMSRVTDHFEIASRSLSGGVSSSTRVNKALGHPLYIREAHGSRVRDLDGNEYLDLCCSHGANLLGHGDPRVRAAIDAVLDRGFPSSYEDESVAEFAKLLCETVPCLDRVRFTCSGSEATMHCLRLARAFTGRQKILKFEGNFHGYHDQVMFATGTPADKLGPETNPTAYPSSAGVTAGMEQNLVLVPYNRPDLFEEAFHRHAHELAVVLCEPIYYNAGCIIPSAEFLATLRRLTREHGVLLMFDEVLCAFRMAPGGAQQYLGVTPDLCTLGKSIGGGLPLSAFGGRRDIMDRLMPLGDCQHSGTYNANLLAVAAGLAAVRAFVQPGFYDHIFQVADRLYGGMNAIFGRHHVPARVQGLGARFGLYFGIPEPVRSYRDAVMHHREHFLRFVRSSIAHGVYFHDYGGAACHHGFCAATTLADVDDALQRLDDAVRAIA